MKHSGVVAAVTLAFLAGLGGLLGCGGSINGQVSTTPSIASFAPSPATITTGASSSLAAIFTKGTGVITPGNIAVISGTPVSITPSATTTYTLTVTGPTGTVVTSTATVTVVATPSIASFVSSPATITAGNSSGLTATFSNGTGVITPGNMGVTSGTPVSVNPSATTTYTLTVTNLAGTAVTATATVNVVPAPSIASFVSSPATITVGNSTSLTAAFSNGTGVITPGNMSVTSGTPVSITPSASTTYTLTVTNPAGTAVTASATATVVPSPTISSFVATPSSIAAGEYTNLAADFANGTGVITPGSLAILSGNQVSVTPPANATTTYTLTVTNAAGTAVTATTSVAVSAALMQPPDLGVNISGPVDYDPTQLFADAMKQARKFGSTGSPYDESATVDSLGWPTQDAGVYVLDITGNQGTWTDGNYALSFTGQAMVTNWDDGFVSVGPVTYNSATNTSTATVTVSPGYGQVVLVFTNTMRTPTSPLHSGVTNISLMRPSINGTPLAPGTIFNDRFLDRLKYFSAIRMMDYLDTNDNTEEVWTDRSIPAYASQQEVPPHTSQSTGTSPYVTGGSYEYAIQLANEAGKDLWLNIPHLAFGGTYQFSSTTWVANLALLMKFGSDVNGNPYTGLNGTSGANPQPASGPVNPPLKPGLHIYIEFSNELWNNGNSQSGWIQQQANAALAAHDPDLDWDNDPNEGDLEWRIEAKADMLTANAFANVYGSTNFGTIYRPVFGGQLANDATYDGLNYLQSQHGGANLYVWAIMGSVYDGFNGDVPNNTLAAAQVISAMQSYQSTNIQPWVENLKALLPTWNLEGGMLAYEGGQGALNMTSGEVAAQTTPAMRGVITGLLDFWFGQGGGTFFYYNLCSAGMWGLSTDISYDIDADTGYTPNPVGSTEAQPKWGAIKQIATLGQ